MEKVIIYCLLSLMRLEPGDIQQHYESVDLEETKGSSFFTQHIFNLWNPLPQDDVDAVNLTRFKGGRDQGMQGEWAFTPISEN